MTDYDTIIERLEDEKQLTFHEGFIGEDMKRYPSELDCEWNNALNQSISIVKSIRDNQLSRKGEV